TNFYSIYTRNLELKKTTTPEEEAYKILATSFMDMIVIFKPNIEMAHFPFNPKKSDNIRDTDDVLFFFFHFLFFIFDCDNTNLNSQSMMRDIENNML
ncbi:hypothetical protein ACJX0J_030988, partial [Zea mays]